MVIFSIKMWLECFQVDILGGGESIIASVVECTDAGGKYIMPIIVNIKVSRCNLCSE